jgi:hypothetical protein
MRPHEFLIGSELTEVNIQNSTYVFRNLKKIQKPCSFEKQKLGKVKNTKIF